MGQVGQVAFSIVDTVNHTYHTQIDTSHETTGLRRLRFSSCKSLYLTVQWYATATSWGFKARAIVRRWPPLATPPGVPGYCPSRSTTCPVHGGFTAPLHQSNRRNLIDECTNGRQPCVSW